MAARLYRFRDFIVDPAARELRRGDESFALPASAFDCLAYLIEHRERAVGRDELIAAIWGRADVTDSLLAQTLVRVRRTLGDTGNEQHTIRTVPRFGYRWVAPVESIDVIESIPVIESVDAVRRAAGDTARIPFPAAASATIAANADAPAPIAANDPLVRDSGVAPTESDQAPLRALGRRRPAIVALVLALLTVVAAVVYPVIVRRPPITLGAPALVLPARVDAGDDWIWLRLGLMDLVANELRRADVATAPSESVLALVGSGREDGDALLARTDLGAAGTLRVLPSATLRAGRWNVQLKAVGAGVDTTIDAAADDVLTAARHASDLLLLRLGRVPKSSSEPSVALDELLYRTRAAMLGDQLQLARTLIEQAAPELSERPEIELRRAQIELRAGEYDAVQSRLTALLDRLPSATQPVLRGRALNTLAATHVRRDAPDEAAKNYAEAIPLLQGRREPAALGLSYLGRGLVASMHGDYDRATADLGLARSEMEAGGDALGIAQVDLNLGLFESLRLRPAAALSSLRAAEQRLARLGAQEEHVFALASIAEVQQDLLEQSDALATSDRYWPPESHSQNARLRWKLVLVRAEAMEGNGRLDEAQALVDRVQAESDPQRDAGVRAEAAALGARIAYSRGDPSMAARLAAATLTPALETSDLCRYTQTWMTRIRALQRSDAVVEAGGEVARLRRWADGTDSPWRRIYATLAEAEQAWVEGRRDDARTLFASALAQSQAAGDVPEDIVEIIQPYSRALIEMGHVDEARALSVHVARWADRDLRAALVFVQLHEAANQPAALRDANERALALAGQRPLPRRY